MLRSSLLGSCVGLSFAELRRTSTADKQWLGISEEQLLNEIFADEFYRRLHNPQDSWHTQDVEHTDDLGAPNQSPSCPFDDVFLPYILQLEPPIPDTVNCLLKDLLKVSI